MSPRELNAIYSDDIRHEVGGKLSYIGVYNAEMWVRSFPVLLPRFCISVSVSLPVAHLTDSLLLRILRDDQVLHEAELITSPLEVDEDFQREQADLGRETFVRVQSHVVFSPFTVDDPCYIRVRVVTGDQEELKTGALRIRLGPETHQVNR